MNYELRITNYKLQILNSNFPCYESLREIQMIYDSNRTRQVNYFWSLSTSTKSILMNFFKKSRDFYRMETYILYTCQK